MSLISTTIASVCIGLTQPQLDACNKAIEAGTKQTGLDAISNTTEKQVNDKALSIAQEYIGIKTIDVIGSIAYLTKTVQTQTITLQWKF